MRRTGQGLSRAAGGALERSASNSMAAVPVLLEQPEE
jgi:hypothetical protein